MSTEFTREDRYIVFKLSDVERYLTDADRAHLAMMKNEIDAGRDCANKPPFKGLIVESDWPEYEPTWRAIEARVAGAQPAPNAVAYLDLGVGGYMDVGTDLTDEELAALPKGRHMLGIVGTCGIEGYVPAQPAPSMADVDYLVDTLSKFADHHVEHGRMSFDKWTLRSAVETMLAAAPEGKP